MSSFPVMHARVCRFRLTARSGWENGIIVRVDTKDTRDQGTEGNDTAETIIGPLGDVYYPRDLHSYDDLPRYGAFRFDPENA